VVTPSAHGPYLSKFAVDVREQGEGFGRDLWVAMGDQPSLFWRARKDNPVNGWYMHQCEGMVKLSTWNVYWRGLAAKSSPAAIEFASQLPADFARD
jgi:acetylglutamate kinase